MNNRAHSWTPPEHDHCAAIAARPRALRIARRHSGYVLLETVVATGLLIVGLAVIGAQVQNADTSVRKMERRQRALMLAEQHLAELDLGLIELDSLDEVEEGDFGPRHPDWGWRMITEPIAIEGLFRLTVEVLFYPREDAYREDNFEWDQAEVLHTVWAFRPAPRPIDFAVDLGLNDEEMIELNERMGKLSLPGLNLSAFDPTLLARLDQEELMQLLPLIMDAFGFQLEDVVSFLPPDMLEELKKSGLFGQEKDETAGPPGGGRG